MPGFFPPQSAIAAVGTTASAQTGPKLTTSKPRARMSADDTDTDFTLSGDVHASWNRFTNAWTNGLPHGVNRAAQALARFPQAVL